MKKIQLTNHRSQLAQALKLLKKTNKKKKSKKKVKKIKLPQIFLCNTCQKDCVDNMLKHLQKTVFVALFVKDGLILVVSTYSTYQKKYKSIYAHVKEINLNSFINPYL